MNTHARYSAEWLEKNCDVEIPFERAVKKELGRLLAERKSGTEVTKALGWLANQYGVSVVQLSGERDLLLEALLAMIDREDHDCMPAGWSVDRVREIARKAKRRSSDRAVRRSHDDAYLHHSVKATRTGRAT